MFKSTHTPGLDGGQALINSLDQAEKLRKGGGKKKKATFFSGSQIRNYQYNIVYTYVEKSDQRKT